MIGVDTKRPKDYPVVGWRGLNKDIFLEKRGI